jgi:hypothetical protein
MEYYEQANRTALLETAQRNAGHEHEFFQRLEDISDAGEVSADFHELDPPGPVGGPAHTPPSPNSIICRTKISRNCDFTTAKRRSSPSPTAPRWAGPMATRVPTPRAARTEARKAASFSTASRWAATRA